MKKGRDKKGYINQIKIFEAFAGIGSQYLALKNIAPKKNWKIKSVGYIEWYVNAIIAYELLHNEFKEIKKETFGEIENVNISFDSKTPATTKNRLINSYLGFILNRSKSLSNNLFDISKVDYKSIPKNIDIFTYSFPCQDLSNQGKQKGMNQENNTRSGLLWEVKRLLSDMHKNLNTEELPNYLLMENVVAIKNKKHILEYRKWIKYLEDLNYESYEYELDSKYFKVPQSRKRVFLLSVRKDFKYKVGFEFNKELNKKTDNSYLSLSTIVMDNEPYEISFNKYKLSSFKQINDSNKASFLNYTNFNSENYVYDINYCGPTLTASGALSRIKLFFGSNKIRYMNAKEAFLYMGFKEKHYQQVKKYNLLSDRQLIFIMGNSIVVNVLEAIFSTLKFEGENNE